MWKLSSFKIISWSFSLTRHHALPHPNDDISSYISTTRTVGIVRREHVETEQISGQTRDFYTYFIMYILYKIPIYLETRALITRRIKVKLTRDTSQPFRTQYRDGRHLSEPRERPSRSIRPERFASVKQSTVTETTFFSSRRPLRDIRSFVFDHRRRITRSASITTNHTWPVVIKVAKCFKYSIKTFYTSFYDWIGLSIYFLSFPT